MKVIIAAIAALGALGSFAGSAMADISINIRFGSSPSYNSYGNYDSYRSNVYQPVYPRHQNNYDHYNSYNRNVNSSVIVREVYPSSSYYGNSWNRTVAPRYIVPSNHPYSTIRSTVYNPYNVDLGDRYIIEKRIIWVR